MLMSTFINFDKACNYVIVYHQVDRGFLQLLCICVAAYVLFALSPQSEKVLRSTPILAYLVSK